MVCKKRISLSFSIEGGQDNTESFEFSLNNVTEQNGDIYIMDYPLSISCSKSRPFYSYQLLSEGLFYFSLEESVIGGGMFTNCVDSANALSPTCGLQFNPITGQKIPYSQGFCCLCTMTDYFKSYENGVRMKKACTGGVGSSSGMKNTNILLK
jgi:hypothetical protein